MSRYFREIKRTAHFNPVKSLTVLFEPSIASPLYSEDVMFNDGTTGVYRHDDIYLLFNQQRLSALGSDGVNAWIQSLSGSKDSPLHELLDKCTDEQKLSLIKSRHIQSASELQAWDSFLSSVSDATVGNIKSYIESLKPSESSESSDSSQPSVSTE